LAVDESTGRFLVKLDSCMEAALSGLLGED